MDVSTPVWIATIVFIVALLAFDFVFHVRKAHVPTLGGISGIAEGYDLILCDVWGVLHDGTAAHRGASDALMRFRALPGAGRPRRVVLVSNAPRPWAGVQTILDGFGIPRCHRPWWNSTTLPAGPSHCRSPATCT